MGPVTTNPYVIALINMTIVFGVLIVLGILMMLIRMVDPTAKKKAEAPKPVAAKAAAPAAAAAAAAPAAKNNDEIIAVIAAAVAACGCSSEQVACIRMVPSAGWINNARAEVMSVRKECF